MAKIALIAGFVALGALTGGLAAAGVGIFGGTFAGGSILAGIGMGAAIGGTVGQVVASLAFPGHSQYTGPRLLDGQISGSADGSPKPFGYGGFRIGGQIIWSSGIKETKTVTNQSAKGGPSTTSTTYSYTTDFAAAFCDGPAGITRIWGDSKLIYDATSKGAVTSNTLATGIGTNTVVISPAIYTGTSTQMPDPTMQAAVGITQCSANRDLVYIVYDDFPLADFGNRLPNIRAEISTGQTQAYLYDIIPASGITDTFSLVPAVYPPKYVFIDPVSRQAYVYDSVGMVVQRIDISASNRSPLNQWAAGSPTTIGEQILDSNGHVQLCIANSGDTHTGTLQPTWTNLVGDIIVDNHVTWRNIGAGPEAILVTGQSLMNPLQANQTFSSISQVFGTSGVDTAGNLWLGMFLTEGVVTKFRMVRFDPITFQCNGQIDLPAPPVFTQFGKASDGTDYIAIATATNATNGFMAYIYNARSLSLTGSGTYAVADPTVGGGGQSAMCFDKNGVLYVITQNPSAFKTGIVALDARSGVVTRREGVVTTASLNSSAISVLFNAADNSLIMVTELGGLFKVDIATFTVTATLSVGAGVSIPQLFSKGYTSGQVPATGIMYGLAQPGTLDAVLAIDATALTVVSSTALSNWSTFVGVPSSFTFEPVTHSLMLCDGNQYTWRLFLDRQKVSAQSLDTVVGNVLTKCGIDSINYDVSALAGINVLGYPVLRLGDAKSVLLPLTQAYFFDLVETDFKLKAVLRGGATSTITIPESDLGVAESNNPSALSTTIAQEQDLPKDITVLHMDPAKDYQQGKQMRRRHTKVVKTKNQTLLELPLTLNADTAAQIAQKALAMLWSERNLYGFKLWKALYNVFDPTDNVQFTYGGIPYQTRLEKTNIGQNKQMECSGLSANALAYSSSVVGQSGSGFVGQTLGLAASTLLFLMDLPLLQDTDAASIGSMGFYWAMSSPNNGWPGGALLNSTDDQTYNPIDASTDEVFFGIVSAATPAPHSAMSWDFKTQIVVRVVQGSLSSTTALAVLNGANAAVLGQEVIQFMTATFNSDGTYTLSNLLRGRRGTEWACGKHVSGETFIYLGAPGVHRTTVPTSVLNNLRYYKGVTIGQLASSATNQKFTQQGNDLKPYAVAQLQGTRDVSGNFSLSWLRRTRIGGAWLSGTGTGTVPLAEDHESYDVEVMQLRGNGTQNFPNYSISPAIPAISTIRDFGTGGASVLMAVVGVMPTTVTWDVDGHTASYQGYSLANNTTAAFGVPVYCTVFDPNRVGDANGTALTYQFTLNADFANTPGYVFLGTSTTFDVGLGSPIYTSGGTNNVVRSRFGLSTPDLSYPVGLVTADFGSAVNTLRVRVYQNSAQVGRGFVAENDAIGAGVGSIGGSSNATSIQGINVSTTPPTDGQVLTFVAGSTDIEWKTPFSSARTSVLKTTASLATNASETGTVDMGCKSFMVIGSSATKQCRIQLYSTAALMTADAGRAIGVNPADGSESGVIMDLVLTSLTTWIASPAVLGASMEGSPSTLISYRITNLDTTGTVPVTFNIVPLEK